MIEAELLIRNEYSRNYCKNIFANFRRFSCPIDEPALYQILY